METNRTAIELKGIRKTFGSVVANDNVDFSVNKGEILALLGENGSGKTTLMNMLSGLYKPDSGSIKINGSEVTISSPEDSKHLRIGMVHQHFKLVENFSAADNILIGAENEEDKSFFMSERRFERIGDIAKKFGFDIDPRKKVYDMAVSEKQTVEILKVLYYGVDILILDEPTAVLTVQETAKLFDILRKMKQAGCAIIIITHKLNEVLEISDRVTILRKGLSVGTVETAGTNAAELTDLMVGRATSLSIDRPDCVTDKTLLELKDITILNGDNVKAIDDVSFEVKSGEILGIAGVSGCGQKELCEAIAGLQKIENGEIIYKGTNIAGKTPKEIIDFGISMSFIPEDRLGMGLAASLSITDNMMLKNYCDVKGPFVDRKTARASAKRVIDELEVVTPGTETPVRRLSGGNVQKILLGREIGINPNVIVTAYPVRGLDINSSYTIYNILNDEKQKGVGIVFVGEDLDVMLELCDRILVLCHGKVTGVVDAKSATKEEIGLLMTDAKNAKNEQKTQKNDEKTTEISAPKAEKPHIMTKKPAIRIVGRDNIKPLKAGLIYAISILAAIIIGGALIVANGVNPLEYYKTVLSGCFENEIYLGGLIRIVTPLIITSLGIAIAFKMKFWNIGANGQFIAGAVFAATAAFLLPSGTPQLVSLLVMALAGFVGGGLLGLIPAVCKVKFGTNETLLTLMLNYVAFYILCYLKNTMFFRKLSASGEVLRPDFKKLPENTWMYTLKFGRLEFDLSLIIAIVLVVIVMIYLSRTKQGYEVSIVGDSINTARYAGMNVNKIIIRTMFISAAVAGLAGMLHVSGSATSRTLSDGITSDVGWTGIIVAWLSGLHPVGILITSVLMGILQKGSAVAESVYKIPSATSDILQGVILFTVLAAGFFTRYKLVLNTRKGD